MAPISSCKRRVAGTAKLAVMVLVLLDLVLFPGSVAAQGLPVETASPVPLATWFIGAAILGLAIAYGVMRNRTRTRAEKQTTEQATKKLYAEEDRDRDSSGRG
jgi:hypothetical protein